MEWSQTRVLSRVKTIVIFHPGRREILNCLFVIVVTKIETEKGLFLFNDPEVAGRCKECSMTHVFKLSISTKQAKLSPGFLLPSLDRYNKKGLFSFYFFLTTTKSRLTKSRLTKSPLIIISGHPSQYITTLFLCLVLEF